MGYYKSNEQSIVKIQSIWKGKSSRKKVKELKDATTKKRATSYFDEQKDLGESFGSIPYQFFISFF